MSDKDDIFWGDLERRRPTKRLTTKRAFKVVRNWSKQDVIQQNAERLQSSQPQQNEPSHQRHTEDISTDEIQETVVTPSQPISSQEIATIESNNNNADDSSPLKIPDVSQIVCETSLPGAASITPLNKTNKTRELIRENQNSVKNGQANVDKKEETPILLNLKMETPEKNDPTTVYGAHSGPSKRAVKKVHQQRPMSRKKVTFDTKEYEAHNFVRLFNADRGRKRSVTEVTDLDVVLTNVEEIALDLKNEVDSVLCKKMIKEAFIQFRQTFSNSIDVYKNMKHLQSSNTKVNLSLKNLKEELMDVQEKRRRLTSRIESLQSEYENLEKEKKVKEDAYSFLNEFESLQEKLRNHSTSGKTQVVRSNHNGLSSLISEACGYLKTRRDLDVINDKLQTWLNQHS